MTLSPIPCHIADMLVQPKILNVFPDHFRYQMPTVVTAFVFQSFTPFNCLL